MHLKSQILCSLGIIFLLTTACEHSRDTSFLKGPIDTIQYDIPYTPRAYNIFLHSDESEWELSVAFPQTMHAIYHYKKGKSQPTDTTDLSGITGSEEFNLYFIKNEKVYIIDQRNQLHTVNIKTQAVERIPLPEFPAYESVEYWRAHEVQNIMHDDSCVLLTPFFIFHLNGKFTEDSARSWNYRSYSGSYFANLCVDKNDSVQVELLLDNIRNRYIGWNELAPKVPKYDIGPKNILIPSSYHHRIYLIDKDLRKVRDSFEVVSSYTNAPLKMPTIDFDKRFDTQPYPGPYIRWARQFINVSGDLHYLVGISWPSENDNAYLIQLYNAQFELVAEKILEGNYRYISHAFFKGQKLFIPVKSEEVLMYEIYRVDS